MGSVSKGLGRETTSACMEKDSARQQKRDSARKSKERSIYSQKAVRATEALIKKWQPSTPVSSSMRK